MTVAAEDQAVLTAPASAAGRVAMFEPHRHGHAHMYYSSQLTRALAKCCAGRRFTLLASTEAAGAEASGFEVERVIEVPRALASYRSRLLGMADRGMHWGRADRQIVAWVSAHPDVCLVHYQDAYGLATLCGILVLRLRGVRCLLTVHNVRPHETPWWQPAFVKDIIDRLLWRRFDALVVHSDGLKRTLGDFLGEKSPPIYVVPHGVSETLRSGPLASVDERMHRKQLLFIGAPRPNKGLPVLLRALSLLPEFSLTIVGLRGGDVRYEQYIRELIDSAQRGGSRIRVRKGFVPEEELDTVLRSHSVVMLPYRSDFQAQSGVLSQAIAYRVPVVATEAGAVGETVRNFGLGCVVPPGSPEALAEGVRRLYALSPHELAARLADAAKDLAWSSVAGALVDVYDAVCP